MCSEISGTCRPSGRIAGYAKGQDRQSASAEFVCTEEGGAERLMRGAAFQRAGFSRASGPGAVIVELPETDRISVLLAELRRLACVAAACGWKWSTLTKARNCLPSASKFEVPLRKARWRPASLVDDAEPPTPAAHLHQRPARCSLVLAPSQTTRALWPMGIPRLKFPREAPSRSTFKLEEAWHQFIPREQWEQRLRGDMTGVDLGAAPGGWTCQLVRRGMLVTAIDNGPMAESLMDTGLSSAPDG